MPYSHLKDKSVLITGGTGSFGQRCVNFLLEQTEVRRVVVFSRDELKQHQMKMTISDPENKLRFFLGDVRDLERLKRAFKGVDYIIHAAALKQVPALEYNPFEAVKTNILGTKNVIDAAIDCGVKKVLFISTDKAANPANLYGATKLCAERLVVSGNYYASDKTRLAVVRYGNVIGSRGSLIQIIEQQRLVGEITLTHEEMTRFWIDLDQGVKFVLLALEQLSGGEIFIPKIPSLPVKDIIKIVAPECKIKIIGIRSGEKLHEVLITPEEARHTLEFADYFIILPEYYDEERMVQREGGVPVPEDFYYASHQNPFPVDQESFKSLFK